MPQTTTLKKIFSIYFWILCITTSFSQDPGIDSTFPEKELNDPHSNKLERLLDEARKSFYSNPNQSEQFVTEALNLSQQIGDELAEGDAYNILAQIYSIKGELNEALGYQLQARDKYISLKNELKTTRANINIALIYFSQNNTSTALEYLKEAEILNNKIGDEEVAISININLGNVYAAQKDYDNALQCFEKAEQLTIKFKDEFLHSIVHVNLGKIHLKLDQYDLSQPHIEEALRISKKLDDKEGLAIAHLFKAELELKNNQIEESDLSLSKSIEYALKIENVETLANAHLFKSTLDSLKGNHENSLHHFKEHIRYAEILNKEQIELRLDSIRYSNSLAKIDIELSQHKAKLQFLAFGFVTLSLLVSFFVFHYTKTKKTNTALSKLNKDIQKQNKTIKEQSNQIRLIANNVPAGIAYIDKNAKLLFINSTAREWIDKPQTVEASNIDITGYFIDQNICKRVLNGETVTIEDKTIFKGKNLFVQITCVPDFDDNNIAKGFILLIKDISSIKEAENTKLTSKNIEKQKLRSELDYRNRELFVRTMLISEKNNVLDKIKADLEKLLEAVPTKNVKTIKQVIHTINNSMNQKDNLKAFKVSFERIHPLFFENLTDICPDLSKNELKHCAYIKMNLSNKEVANMLHIGPRSVEMARYRIKKKLNLGPNSLQEYINSIDTN